MKVIDIIFALICGKVVGFVIGEILIGFGFEPNIYLSAFLWVMLPLLALFCLWITFVIGRKIAFVFEGAKFFLVGAFCTVIDLKFFELLVWVFTFIVFVDPLIFKSLSFIFATGLKYWGNKYWAFGKHENEDMGKEIGKFFAITLLGLAVDLSIFYYTTKVLGPRFDLSVIVWVKISVILSALGAAVFNFLGYKFLVFKK